MDHSSMDMSGMDHSSMNMDMSGMQGGEPPLMLVVPTTQMVLTMDSMVNR